MSHKPVLTELIIDNKVEKLAEIGVHGSNLTKYILRTEQCFNLIKEYWAIDPFLAWEEMSGTQNEWDAHYIHACRLARWFPQHHAVRLTSEEAVEMFDNEHFDLVYIDADHRYEAVKRDIEMWLPKVKLGGILAGHDYHIEQHPGCGLAVDTVLGADNIEKMDGSVWVYQI